MSNGTYIYGVWRGLPARQNRVTGGREFFRDELWQGLGLGYDTEFKPHAEELDSDPWGDKHQAVSFSRQ